jgi:hypothetical protein
MQLLVTKPVVFAGYDKPSLALVTKATRTSLTIAAIKLVTT